MKEDKRLSAHKGRVLIQLDGFSFKKREKTVGGCREPEHQPAKEETSRETP